ncbi:VOC family protein [Agromyces mediolanus]|uniref:VOC family protein n=1 Tax=Agromyces mediolanus TaxID=41986 RepID=UPI0020409B5D|nr:VOC family protein [Agromyces mediolanus]MCM3658008.1 VOC family protein [Agromyces mediolanus]
MSVTLNPYLNFRDEARQALEFYHSVFGGTLNVSTFADFGQADPADADKIMHGQIDGDHGITLMAADTPSHLEYRPAAGFSVSLSGDDDAVLRGYYDRLVDGGTVVEPLVVAPWGDAFGMLVDRFGVSWLVNIAGGAQA